MASKMVPITIRMKRRSLIFLTAAAAALVFVSAAWALRFTDESYFTPVGSVGSPYSFTFTGAGAARPSRTSTASSEVRCRLD